VASDLFQRAYKLTVGQTQIDASLGVNTGLAIAFSIARDEKRTPNAIELRINNLSRTHRQALAEAKTVSISLEAGYVGQLGQLFLGDLRTVRSVKLQDGTYETTVSGGDGEALLRTARIAKTFPAGTTVGAVLKGLGAALGVSAGNVANAAAALSSQRIPRARTLHGLVYDELEDFCRTYGLRWSVQDSALQVRTGDAPVNAGFGPLLRADSGLIGTPEVMSHGKATKSGDVHAVAATASGTKVVSFSCLLRADVIPGKSVQISSESYSGNLVIIQTNHTGDSHRGGWQVDAVGRPY
jgi:hypothetical protein